MKRTLWAVLIAGALALPTVAQNYDEGDDPEHGVARLSLMNGDVSVRRGDTGEVVAGELNAPLVALDHVLTGEGSRAEVQFDWATMIRMGPASEIRLGELTDGSYLIQVAEGQTTVRILRDSNAQVEISTPTISVRPTQKGTYRITVRPDGATEVTVRDGQADIFTPRGSEVLREGRTLQARGTASDPEFMIVAGIPKDDWDRWNQDRDRDLDRGYDDYRYVSQSIPGAAGLSGYGRWVYDSPYGWVWVPNVTTGWAPYRIGRWSYVNYYGWTWISGDPWGWAPYHYGNWYSSPYGWAWYPGTVGYRYWWRPAMVGFFGWGSPGLSVGIGFGYGNIGWVPLAPYERFRPWYGRGRTVVNNVTIVNNTNITNVYRNARGFNGRDGVTSINAENFGRQRVGTDNFVRAGNNDLSRAGHVQGPVPFTQTGESRRFNDRTPGSDMAARANRQSPQFATTGGGPVRGGGGPANANRAGVDRTPAARPSNPIGNDGSNVGGIRGGNTGANTGGGWRRFEPNASVNNAPRGGFSDRQATQSIPRPQTDSRAARGGGFSDRGFGSPQPNSGRQAPADNGRFSAPGNPGDNDSRRFGGQQPVQINPPIVRERPSAPSGGFGGGTMRSAPPSDGGIRGGGAPQGGGGIRSAPQGGGETRGGGGGMRGGGDAGGARGAAPAPAGGGGNRGRR
ncbi:MAG: hypothetical protein RL328_2693 [Acidobacteriota bacterium]